MHLVTVTSDVEKEYVSSICLNIFHSVQLQNATKRANKSELFHVNVPMVRYLQIPIVTVAVNHLAVSLVKEIVLLRKKIILLGREDIGHR